MLVISRKKDQSISLGDDVTIKILELSPNRVKLGIVAPNSLKVSRIEEIPLGVDYGVQDQKLIDKE